MLKNLLFVFIFFFTTSISAQVIVINEYSAANHDSNPNSFQDNYGYAEDWVELYNNSGAPVDISG